MDRYRDATGSKASRQTLAQKFEELVREDQDDPDETDLEAFARDATAALERASSDQCRPWSDGTPYRDHLRRELSRPACFHRAIRELLDDLDDADPMEALYAEADAARLAGELGPEWRAQHGINLAELDDVERFLALAELKEWRRDPDRLINPPSPEQIAAEKAASERAAAEWRERRAR